MRAARFGYVVVWCVVVGDLVRISGGDGMERVIYVGKFGGSPRFYVKVRETAQRVWLRRIGERMIDGDWMYGHCIADPDVFADDREIQMMKRDGYLWNAKERLYAEVWNGESVTVYCD